MHECRSKPSSIRGYRRMTEHEIAFNSRFLVLAGSETVTTTLAAAVYFLAAYPRVHNKLAEEVRAQFPREEDVTMRSVNGLKYMMAVLDEAMRKMPPVPGSMSRVVGTKGGDVICGWHIPEGTVLDIWPWASNHLERNFTNAYEFIPERWLDAGDEWDGIRFNKERRRASQPFSMRMVLARLIWNFDLSLGDEESINFPDCKSYAVWIKRHLQIRLTPVMRL
ncbi:trichothecene C-15 hydroxylase [Cladorrhinum samala]|uniref:Trichothecene C-15 hydroxylase n=1 Tax=Cladorrhinum samala TaxID=585594 RepID=A0AAV9HS54_9PEZI|nr:trichothecene C-15 hydroxylase [Cladorrhinum samala]